MCPMEKSEWTAAGSRGLWEGSVVTGTGDRGLWLHPKGERFVLQAIHVLTRLSVEDHGRVRPRLWRLNQEGVVSLGASDLPNSGGPNPNPL